MATQITNAQLDTLAAAVALPYGPLNRVGSVPANDPNVDTKVEFTSAIATTHVWLSYNDLFNGARALVILRNYHAGSGLNVHPWATIRRVAEVVYRRAAAASAPYSDADIEELYDMLRTLVPIIGTSPNLDDQPRHKVVTGFTLSDAGSHAMHVVNTATGKYTLIMWDWGDGTYTFTNSLSPSPANHTYSGAGSKTVIQTIIGAGGIDGLSKVLSVA